MDFTDKGEIIKGFIDAGCTKEQIEEAKKNISNQDKLKEILVNQRQKVLDKIHEDEDKMKCIDYLIYNFQKKNNEFNKETKEI